MTPDKTPDTPPATLVLTGGAQVGALLWAAADPVAALTYYAEVLSLVVQPTEAGLVCDLGPDSPEAAALARAVLSYHTVLSPAVLRARLPSLRVDLASRDRAANAAGRGLRVGSGEAVILAAQPAHAGFFGLEVQSLRHARFDGSQSDPIRREVFVSGDAVTVLPYDPLRDRVLLIEQFHVGPLRRGDPLPWQLEAIAGRIDPGETPEASARREAMEKAGLVLGALIKVAEYYPSPGAMTEYIYSYVAICDLPDGVAGVFGKPEEAEDIKGHLVTFEALMGAVKSGEVANAPLLMTALWLERARSDLRSQREGGQIAHPTRVPG